MSGQPAPGCDLLVVSPHTDDLEIGLGGTVAALTARGRRVWGADLTRGELGTNSDPQERWQEAAAASAVLGLTGRIQLDLPDGFISPHDPGQVAAVAAVLRRLRPRWVITAPDAVRHPDHVQTPLLVGRAVFLARLESYRPDLGGCRVWPQGAGLAEAVPRWQTEALLAVCGERERPSLLFDVTGAWPRKLEALACYPSQFNLDKGRRATMINEAGFLQSIERRARTWGRLAGVELAEAVSTTAVPVAADLPQERWRG